MNYKSNSMGEFVGAITFHADKAQHDLYGFKVR